MNNDFDHEAHAAETLRICITRTFNDSKIRGIFENQTNAAERVYSKLYVENVRTAVLYVM